MQSQLSPDKIYLSFEWKGPNTFTTPFGSSKVFAVDIVFKDTKSQISVSIPEISSNKQKRLAFNCYRPVMDLPPSVTHPEQLRIDLEKVKSLTVKATSVVEQLPVVASSGNATQISRAILVEEAQFKIQDHIKPGVSYCLVVKSKSSQLTASLVKDTPASKLLHSHVSLTDDQNSIFLLLKNEFALIMGLTLTEFGLDCPGKLICGIDRERLFMKILKNEIKEIDAKKLLGMKEKIINTKSKKGAFRVCVDEIGSKVLVNLIVKTFQAMIRDDAIEAGISSKINSAARKFKKVVSIIYRKNEGSEEDPQWGAWS